MTDLATWAAATAEDGRRTGPEKLIAAHVLDFIRRGRMRMTELWNLEQRYALEATAAQGALDSCAHERIGIEMMLQDLCQAIEQAAAPALAKPGRTRKAKAVAQPDPKGPPAEIVDDALAIPAALDRRAAE